MGGSGAADVPSVAVVVPTWNEAAYLPALLASLGLRTDGGREAGAPQEVVVADGGSRDGTPEAAARAGALVVHAPRGRGAQLARGAARARADVLWFVHADARVLPGSLDSLRRAFAERPIVACGVRQRIDGRGLVYRLIERVADLRVRAGRVYGDSGLAVRRSAYEAVGGFRELPLFEDLDLARRLRREGPVVLVPGAGLGVSARRWRAEGPMRCTLRNQLLTLGWLAGVDPARLARYYLPRSGAAGEP